VPVSSRMSASRMQSLEDPAAAAEPALREIRELTNHHRHGEALAALQAIAARFPDNRELLYLTALNQRQLQRIKEALATLETLERHHPRYSRLYQERGHCYVALRDAPRAIDAFLRGVNLNPALPASWSMLEGLYRMSGDDRSAVTAAQHVATLKQLAPDVIQATSLFSDGDLTEAEGIIRAYLLKRGDDIEAMRLLARVGLERDVLDDAELLLEAVLKLAPEYRAARADYARVLLKRQKHLDARNELQQLLNLEPANRELLKDYAAACVGLGDYEPIIELYRRLLGEAQPESSENAELHLWIGHSLKTVGEQPDAIGEYRAALALRPAFGDAWWSLANLKTYTFSMQEIERMRAAESGPQTSAEDRYHLCFALGKAYEDRAEFEQSWQFYVRGNAQKHARNRYLPAITETNTRLQKAVCSEALFAARHGWGAAAADPIFIVGLPRAGSTLIEQILASHSLVEGTQELADVQRQVLKLRGRAADLDDPRFPAVLADLQEADFRRFGERYIADTRVYRRTARPYFIDKMPNNFRYLGLIHLMLPNAKIIDARREPMACCFGNFKQLFSSGQEFTYSIEDIARYYRTYLELMRHWDAVLPGRVLRVQHEDLIEDLEGNVRRMLQFCGLPFEPACLEFHKTERSVRTASSEQVRRPIFREGMDQWRNFEPWLKPLEQALGDAHSRYRE
jgi:tetratricopeptide (TPR) repeat protein